MGGIIGTGGCVNKGAVWAVDSWLREQLGSHQGEVNRAGATTYCHHTFCHKNCNYLIKGTSVWQVEQMICKQQGIFRMYFSHCIIHICYIYFR